MKKVLLSTMIMIMANAYAVDCAGLAGKYNCVPELENIDSYELVISNNDGKMKFVSDPFDLTFGESETTIIEGTKGAISCEGFGHAKIVVTVSSQTLAKHAQTGEEFLLEEEASVLSDIIKLRNGNVKIINRMGAEPGNGYVETCTKI